jgi:hypothetical protein
MHPEKRNEAWLRKSGLYLNTGLALIGCIVHFSVFYKMSGYIAPPVHFFSALLLVLGLIIFAGHIKRNTEQKKTKSAYWYLLTGVITFMAGAIWLSQIIFVAQKNKNLSPWPTFLIISLLTAFLIAALFKLIKEGVILMQQFSIATGMLMVSMLFGLIVLTGSGNRIDVYFQLGFICIVILLMIKLKKRLTIQPPYKV